MLPSARHQCLFTAFLLSTLGTSARPTSQGARRFRQNSWRRFAPLTFLSDDFSSQTYMPWEITEACPFCVGRPYHLYLLAGHKAPCLSTIYVPSSIYAPSSRSPPRHRHFPPNHIPHSAAVDARSSMYNRWI